MHSQLIQVTKSIAGLPAFTDDLVLQSAPAVPAAGSAGREAMSAERGELSEVMISKLNKQIKYTMLQHVPY